MPLREEHYTFSDEIERLENRRRELANEAADLPEDSSYRTQLVQEGVHIDQQLKGLYWARDDAHDDEAVPQWDSDVDGVTLAGLTGGEYGAVEDDAQGAGQQAGTGTTRVLLVAKGTVNAPYVDGVADEDGKVAAVAQLPAPYLQWAETHIDEMTTLGNPERASFGSLLAEASEESDET